jgi:monomeric sarcosine oxidase
MSVRATHDVVVVGAGLMGAASAWSLARRGRSVLVVEQFEPGHTLGSSHGSSRIVRRAYADATYTRLAGRAFELWRELELSSGTAILRMLGALDFGPGRAVPLVAENLAASAVAHEILPASEAERRWPGMVFAGDVLFHAQGGTMDPALAITTFLAQGGRNGAEVRFSTAVRRIAVQDDHALVELADGSTFRARQVVVAAGAWVDGLIGDLVPLPPLVVSEQQVFHFPRLDPAAPPWPSVIHKNGREIYHLAGGRDGGLGDDRKVGQHDHRAVTTARGRSGVIDPVMRERITGYVSRWLPGLDPTPRTEASCLYTLTPSENFLLDRVGPLIVCSPCSGHGAKFAPLVGELVADLVETSAVPDRFRLAAHAVAHAGSVSL